MNFTSSVSSEISTGSLGASTSPVLLGFASGVMIAASIWSLIMPSIDMAKEQGKIAWIPASIGFLFGIVFLLVFVFGVLGIIADSL